MTDYQYISVEQRDKVRFVTLNRPEQRNAMNLAMVNELIETFQQTDADVIVLRGRGDHFCAGGDIKDMQLARAEYQNGNDKAFVDFNRQFGRLLTVINEVPQTVIAVLQGTVMGGGVGLSCVADITLSDKTAQFALPETGLGIPPAQIAPFLVQRIGLPTMRHLALTGARFDAEKAEQLELVNVVCETNAELQSTLHKTLKQILRCAPGANQMTKALLLKSAPAVSDELLDQAAEMFSASITGDEGQEGTLAFIQKRQPNWCRRVDALSGDTDNVY